MRADSSKCLFCGGNGLTKGHVWPRWIRSLLSSDITHHTQILGQFASFEPRIAVKDKNFSKHHQGHAASRKPRNTCRKCNGGWMSQIEGSAKVIVAPLIYGERFVINSIAQISLSTFICLVSIRFDLLLKDSSISSYERLWIMKNFTPSKNWKIWIAYYGGNDFDSHWARAYSAKLLSTPPNKSDTIEETVHISTMVIGRLCTHIMYCRSERIRNVYRIRLCQIWPPSFYPIDSGRISLVDDDGVIALHEKFARSLDITLHGPL